MDTARRPTRTGRPRATEVRGLPKGGTLAPNFAALAVAAGLLAPTAVRADVFEVSNGVARVVAGRPSAPPTESETASQGPAYTAATVSAGPDEWRATIAVLAAKYEISPALLEAVVWQESRWRATATSSAGAHGLAQLMPGTAKQLGVDIHDPRANLEGGARYLRMQLDAFGGDVEKALAAYNAGPRRVGDAGGIPNIPETQAYVAAILARLSANVRR